MQEVTVESVISAKYDFKYKLHEMIVEFEKSTGTNITQISVERTDYQPLNLSTRESIFRSVDIEVQI